MASGCKLLNGIIEGQGNPVLGGDSFIRVTIDRSLLTLNSRPLYTWAQNTGVTTVAAENGNLPVLVGTASLLVDTTGSYINYLSTTTLNIRAGWAQPATAGVNQVQTQQFPEMVAVIKTGAAATDITPVRIWVGIGPSADQNVSKAADSVTFRYNTTEDAHTTWWAYAGLTSAGGAFVDVDTGVAVTTNTRYVLRIKMATTGRALFEINDELVAIIEGTAGVDFPVSSTSLSPRVNLSNGAAGTARNFRARTMVLVAT